MNSEVSWVLVSSGTQAQPQITLDPDYLLNYLSVSYECASIYYCHFFVVFSSTEITPLFMHELTPFFMYNKYVLTFNTDLVSFFPPCLKHSVAETKTFLFPERKIHEKKVTESHNKLKPTENELKMNLCLLTFYLNHFNPSALMFDN